jgi:inward rectifier potassium channel
MSWRRFLAIVLLTYFAINVVFGLGFLLIGVDNLANVSAVSTWTDQFTKAFFFSVQTFTTVGYGAIHPIGVAANLLASITALSGLMSVALATGLVFARFSQPREQIRFSAHAVIAPYLNKNLKSLQFRIANQRDTNLINLRANVVLTWLEEADAEGNRNRRFAPLKLEREFVALFPLNWTIVHPIDEDSPLASWKKNEFCRRYSEILIMIEGYDQTYAQTIHANSSYTHEEVDWNTRFQPMYFEEADRTILHLDRIDLVWEEE